MTFGAALPPTWPSRASHSRTWSRPSWATCGRAASHSGIYNRSTYAREQGIALQRWADVMGSTTTDNVVKLKNPQPGRQLSRQKYTPTCSFIVVDKQ